MWQRVKLHCAFTDSHLAEPATRHGRASAAVAAQWLSATDVSAVLSGLTSMTGTPCCLVILVKRAAGCTAPEVPTTSNASGSSINRSARLHACSGNCSPNQTTPGRIGQSQVRSRCPNELWVAEHEVRADLDRFVCLSTRPLCSTFGAVATSAGRFVGP